MYGFHKVGSVFTFMKQLYKLVIFLVLVGGVFYAIDYFDIHIQEFDPTLLERVEERKEKAGAIRNEEPRGERETFEGTVQDVVALANEARRAQGVNELSINASLMESAMLKAEDMKEKDYFDHITPEGLDISYFVNAAGYNFSTIGENLAEGYFSAQSVHEAWMNSEGHRENMLSSDYEEIGVAVLEIEKEGNKSFLSVQHFGTKLKRIEQTTEIVTICDKKIKRNCEKAKENREEVKDTIEKQEEIIKDAKKDGYSSKDLQDLYDNLEKLEDIKDDLKDYLKDCEKMFDQCDKWE